MDAPLPPQWYYRRKSRASSCPAGGGPWFSWRHSASAGPAGETCRHEWRHGTSGGVRQCAQYGLILASCNVLVGADGGNRADAALCADASWRLVRRGAGDDACGPVETQFAALWICDAVGSRGKQVSRRVQPPDTENRTSGGVGGCRGAIPVTRPDRYISGLDGRGQATSF